MFVIPVQAQVTSEFGYQLHPEKLLENTEGKLQIFVTSNDMMVPMQIENLKIISSDNSIIQILGVENGTDEFIWDSAFGMYNVGAELKDKTVTLHEIARIAKNCHVFDNVSEDQIISGLEEREKLGTTGLDRKSVV